MRAISLCDHFQHIEDVDYARDRGGLNLFEQHVGLEQMLKEFSQCIWWDSLCA